MRPSTPPDTSWIQTEEIRNTPPLWLPVALGLLMAVGMVFVWAAITGGPPSTGGIPGQPSPYGYPPSCATVGP